MTLNGIMTAYAHYRISELLVLRSGVSVLQHMCSAMIDDDVTIHNRARKGKGMITAEPCRHHRSVSL